MFKTSQFMVKIDAKQQGLRFFKIEIKYNKNCDTYSTFSYSHSRRIPNVPPGAHGSVGRPHGLFWKWRFRIFLIMHIDDL